jgi:magnesium chelatase subunit D
VGRAAGAGFGLLAGAELGAGDEPEGPDDDGPEELGPDDGGRLDEDDGGPDGENGRPLDGGREPDDGGRLDDEDDGGREEEEDDGGRDEYDDPTAGAADGGGVTRLTKIGSSSSDTGPSAAALAATGAGFGAAVAATGAGVASVSVSSPTGDSSWSSASRTRGGRVAFCSALASAFFLCGPITMIMFRPSCFGVLST